MPASYLDMTRDLIRIPSTADRPDALRAAIAYAADALAGTPGLTVNRFERNGKPSLVARVRDTRTPRVLLLGHLDVVPAPAELFTPREERGQLIGRGACDMKSEVAVMVDCVRELVASAPSAPDIALAITSDEEIGGRDGAAYLVDELGYRPAVAFVPDGGEGIEEIVRMSKGVLHVRLTARGKSAHGSRPWLGENAIEALVAAALRIRQAFPDREIAEHWHDTCSVGTIAGGNATNQVPDLATCTIDIRHTEGTDPDALLYRIRTLAVPCAVEVLSAGPVRTTALDNAYLLQYAEVVRKAIGREVRFTRTHGADDGRHLAAHDVPIIVSRPRSGGQHSAEEWVDLAGLAEFRQCLGAFLAEVCVG